MLEKHTTLQMKNSASIKPKNLSIFNDNDSFIYAVLCKNLINLTFTNDSGNELNQKTLIPKIAKELVAITSNSATAASTENSIYPSLIEASYIYVSKRCLYVVCTTKGIFFYEEDGQTMLFYQNFNDLRPNQVEETSYARGIAAIEPNLIAIGNSSGSIYLFDIPSKGTNIVMANKIHDKNLNTGITSLVSDSNLLFASDSLGNISSWCIRSSDNPKPLFTVRGNSNACTCLGICKNYLIACYGNGLISVYDTDTGRKLADITAHARWITCMDSFQDKFVTAGEDCFLRLWQITEVNHQIKVMPIHSEHLIDCFITGVVFNRKTSDICVTCYDSNDILIYKPQ